MPIVSRRRSVARIAVPSLRELQASIAGALLGADASAAAEGVDDDGLAPRARLDIYRHHVVTTLTAALEATFPVVCRLVDRRFFAYAADAYIREHPPESPCLFEYGDTFPKFLGDFPPCRSHRYLPDVARLEWALEVARHAPESGRMDRAQLSAMAIEEMPRLTVSLEASLSLVASPWPIDQIWKANQPDVAAPPELDLAAGGAHLEVRRVDGAVVMRSLDPASHAFRSALAQGHTLEQAADAALAIESEFDVTGAIRNLIEDGVWVQGPAREGAR